AQQLFLQLSRQENIGGLNRTNLIKDIGQLERGDVVFFSGTYDNGRVVTHTGIIIDQGPPALMRHHPTFRKGIQDAQISPGSYYERHFYAAVKPHQKDSTDSKEGPAVT
ncbi:hypothetical protein HY605_02120, partial [Candidatus Peregrinibacteria bacterium]|nr:hypothetical protein [Candidatus Peregrinibacteria bacterium]